jgi:hypothetical protein
MKRGILVDSPLLKTSEPCWIILDNATRTGASRNEGALLAEQEDAKRMRALRQACCSRVTCDATPQMKGNERLKLSMTTRLDKLCCRVFCFEDGGLAS